MLRAPWHSPVAVADDDDYGYAPKKQKVQVEKPTNPGTLPRALPTQAAALPASAVCRRLFAQVGAL